MNEESERGLLDFFFALPHLACMKCFDGLSMDLDNETKVLRFSHSPNTSCPDNKKKWVLPLEEVPTFGLRQVR